MKISVIVPVWNAESCLSRCVDSILAQTHRELELILVDDGSTDASPALCDACAAADARVRVIHKPNGGPSAARNAGLDIACGEWIAFADSDDFMDARQLDYLLGLCTTQDTTMAVCGYELAPMDAAPAAVCAPLRGDACETIDCWRYIERLYTKLQVMYVVPWGKLYARSLFDGLRYPEGVPNEDDCLIHSLAVRAKKIAVSNEPLHTYCINNKGISLSGIPVEKWVRTFPYKEDRLTLLRQNGQYPILYLAQRLFFYTLLLERSRLTSAQTAFRGPLHRRAAKLWLQLAKNPAASRRECLSMLLTLLFPRRICGRKNEDLLI